jgi:hypothetical protein
MGDRLKFLPLATTPAMINLCDPKGYILSTAQISFGNAVMGTIKGSRLAQLRHLHLLFSYLLFSDIPPIYPRGSISLQTVESLYTLDDKICFHKADLLSTHYAISAKPANAIFRTCIGVDDMASTHPNHCGITVELVSHPRLPGCLAP